MPKKEKAIDRGRRTIRSPSLGSHSDQNHNQDGSRHRTRSPSSVPSDFEFFQLSGSEEEEDGDKEWPVKAVVGEAVLGNRQMRYQVEWEGWQRADGTSTTWTIGLPGAAHLIDKWDEARRKERLEKAKKTPNISLSELNKYMPHDFRTFENDVAYHEKLQIWGNDTAYWGEWLKRDEHDSVSKEPVVQKEEESRTSLIPESSRKRKRPPESSASGGHASSSRLVDEGSTIVGSSTSVNRLSRSSSVAQGQPSQSNPRSLLQNQWDRALLGTGAARITLINEIDEEECPILPPRFKYLENYCNYDVDVPDPRTEDNKAFLLGCECEDGCNDVWQCSCLQDSGCVNEDDEPAPAYSKKGLFLFNNQSEVVECNENCACERQCNNTVAQKARKLPIEVFKTRNNGWGARAPVRIRRGTVLGFYTGKIVKRERLAQLAQDEREYSFDLDVRDGEDGLETYSVCAYNQGNWTRFVNHSCSPNAMVYSVVFDAPVSANMPYIALVATEDIPPKKEITIDYNPAAARKKSKSGKKKKGGKSRATIKDEDVDVEMSGLEGKTVCVCQSEVCRGFI